MDWVISGIWGDENMPPIELLESELFGTRVSPIIDISPAIEKLGVIRSGGISWRTNLAKYSKLDVAYSLDGGNTYHEPVGDKRLLLGVNNHMRLKIRLDLRSRVVDILPADRLEVYEVVIWLSDEPWDESWNDRKEATLKWNSRGGQA